MRRWMMGFAFVAVFAIEGVSFAETVHPRGILSAGEVDAADKPALAAVLDLALPRPLLPSDRDPSTRDLAVAGLCRISRHPRDGLPPERHECPPLVASRAGAPRSSADAHFLPRPEAPPRGALARASVPPSPSGLADPQQDPTRAPERPSG